MMNPLPNVNKAHAMIAFDESQRVTTGTRIGGDVHESMALYAGKGNDSMMQSNKGKNVCNSYDPMAMYTGRGRCGSTRNGSNYKQKKNLHLVCDYCKLHGHTNDICYRMIGYPVDWKFKKKFGPGQGVLNIGKTNYAYIDNQATDEFEHVEGSNINSGSLEHDTKMGHIGHENQLIAQPTFTPNQYNKILQMIDKEDSLEYMTNTTDLSNGMVNGIGKERNGLYYLPNHFPERVAYNERNTLMSNVVMNLEGFKWHNRLGHPSMKNQFSKPVKRIK
ncbi:hypothetical protein KY290_007335 [Solanum tuberosum]|uniref:GAG-pre-integrase domain-containing protein n=1 Tax=Solanum tuberosum TaxID=4113 RepID=A0ABQ7W5B5_SOLTU|nr:hypothetical protein KY290_007335 [Solanum tuberosum]